MARGGRKGGPRATGNQTTYIARSVRARRAKKAALTRQRRGRRR